ncbi:hypothetical protein HPB48_022472 [Haemaphysalis longicornis]|uniref:Uncharacterized protein n=1 Tax=Haemaphysalis longicornis TaxID=44386 RepID=A0A9J6FRE5_HAELO|nr:hypothetical protein HPB48_022472 [Haemaphysalis longicornis]
MAGACRRNACFKGSARSVENLLRLKKLACYAMSVLLPAAPGLRAFESWRPLAALLAGQLLGGGLAAAPWELPQLLSTSMMEGVWVRTALCCAALDGVTLGGGPQFAVGSLLGLLIRPRHIRAESSGCTVVICQRSRYTCSWWPQPYPSRPWPAVFGQGRADLLIITTDCEEAPA